MIKFGDKGPEVAEVQKLLSLIGYILIVDAHFGQKTLDSVKNFQKKQGLVSDGIVGNKTLHALRNHPKTKIKESQIIPQNIDYGDIVVEKLHMPDNQYIKQITPKTQIYIHFTAGWPSAKNTIHYWNSDEVRVATSYVIDGNTGIPYEVFHPDYWAYHLGVKGTNGKLDKTSLGIEICAFGPLLKKGQDFYAWPNKYTTAKVDAKDVYTLDTPFRGYTYYFKYTDAQLENVEKLLRLLITRYKIPVQKSFDMKWLDYNQDVIKNILPGIWSHTSVRKDKFDTYPDQRLFDILNKLAKEFN